MNAPAPAFWAGSAAWSALNAFSRGLEMAGLAPARARLPGARVISVGNIQAGGAGKTPLVIQIAREGLERGHRVILLCRGYRGNWEESGGVLAPADSTPDPADCGDEAALLHGEVPGAWIGVGRDRAARFAAVRSRMDAAGTPAGRGPDLVVLDDGFQNRRVHKDLEIVAVTSARWGERWFRDWPAALGRADLLVWTKGGRRPNLPAERPCARVRFELAAPALGFPRLCLVTGLADGRAARETVEHAGYSVARHLEFADHARYDRREARELLEAARARGERLGLTGKDWVKWRALGFAREEVEVLEPRLVFAEGRELWERALWGS